MTKAVAPQKAQLKTTPVEGSVGLVSRVKVLVAASSSCSSKYLRLLITPITALSPNLLSPLILQAVILQEAENPIRPCNFPKITLQKPNESLVNPHMAPRQNSLNPYKNPDTIF